MPDLPVAVDQLGRLISDHGKHARAVVVVDRRPARLLIVTDGGNDLLTETYTVTKIERSGWGVKNYIFHVAGSEDTIVLAPSTCGCGAGRVTHADPTPGFVRVPTRMPTYLEDM